MHELSLCADLMDQVTALAKTHQAEKVVRIVVKIGPLAGVEPHLLESAFTISCAGTLAEEAEFITESLPIRVLCNVCAAETEAPRSTHLLCGECASANTQLLSGDELILAQVELLN